MQKQLNIIKEQLDSLKWEAHHQGLDSVSPEFYPVVDMAIRNLSNDLANLQSIITDAEKKGKRQYKKRKPK